MKEEKIYQAITDLPADLLENVEKPKKNRHPIRWFGAVAAVLVVAILIGIMLRPGGSPTAFALAVVEYPSQPPYPDESMLLDASDPDAAYDRFTEILEVWEDSEKERRECLRQYDVVDFSKFFTRFSEQFLSDNQGGNAVVSPINVYVALAMLAEITEGDSRQQILDLLEAPNLPMLRHRVGAIWRANYIADGATTKTLANSLWLDSRLDYVQSTVDTLSSDYLASVYQGTMGDEAYTDTFRGWLNEQTGGLLEDAVGNLELDAETILAIASTIHFRAKWDLEFDPSMTEQMVFHGTSGDRSVDFMKQTYDGPVYGGSNFIATPKAFAGYNDAMWLILPDEGSSPEDILRGSEWMELLTDTEAFSRSYPIIHLSLPKFDISSTASLNDSLKILGVTDVFSSDTSDFSPITNENDVSLGSTLHSVRVTIDEEGCTAAAFTAMMVCGACPPEDEIDFTLDRPFLFVITGSDSIPDFVGIVNNP